MMPTNPSCESCELEIADHDGHLTSDGVWLCGKCYRSACEEHCPDEGSEAQP
jgi:heterodisulfide reductase subunit C